MRGLVSESCAYPNHPFEKERSEGICSFRENEP